MDRIMETGEIFRVLHMARATGATISTVATLSINADTMPEKRDMKMVTYMTFEALSRILSARNAGMLESIKYSTMTMVPEIIIKTFQLMIRGICENGRIPRIR